MEVALLPHEIAELDKQDPSRSGDGGFQSLMVRLQNNVDRSTGKLSISKDDLKRIPKYAFDYDNGGWEERLKNAFSRTLGPTLGR